MTTEDARDVALRLLASRAGDATVCPSEVARALANHEGAPSEDWRSRMPQVHAAIDRLLREGAVQLSWKRHRLETRHGAYRIGRANKE